MLTEAYLAAALVPFLVLSLAHWFPWGDLPGRHGEPLPRLVTYSIGTFAIVGLTSTLAIRYAASTFDVLLLLWIVTVSAGITTLLAWLVDDRNKAHAKARAGEIVEKAMRDGRD